MEEIKLHKVYRHFKGIYCIVEDIAYHSETQEKYVIYRELREDNKLWIRPYDMFLSEVDHEKYPDITQKHRFEYQDIDNIMK